MDYTDLLKYPEFDAKAIEEKHTLDAGENEAGEPMQVHPDFIFDTKIAFNYIILVYAPESDLASVKDMIERKELAAVQSNVPSHQIDKVLKNENPMIGDMLTRFFREYEDFDYELLISGKEALITLLEVVRKPMASTMLDDKERNAVKAKKECFEDAQFIMAELRKMLNELSGKSADAGEHVRKGVFGKGGFAEHLADGKK